MAELRTIEKPLDIGVLSVTGSILSLPDEYIIIPHLLYTSRKFDDYVLTVIGPNGIFLLSYQLFVNAKTEYNGIEDYIIYLREYAVKLNEYFTIRNIFLNVEPKLIIVVDQSYPDVGGEPDDLLIVSVNNLKKLITSTIIDKPLSRGKIQELTYAVRASGQFKRINQYQLLMELEYSGSVITYLAYDTVLDRSVAIKEIKNYTNPTEIEDLENNEYIREAKLTMQLQHKNIISIDQIIPRDDSLYIVQEWNERACTLRELISSSKSIMDPEIAKSIIIQLCSALEHSHSHGVVHRNVRPENIIISEDYVVKLTNFDLAKKLDTSTRSTFDLKQMIKENPYAAPEFRLGSEGHHNIDQRVDIYSTGVILYELLTNRLPTHLDERYWEPPSLYNLQVSKEMDKITLKAIRFDPHQRYGTIESLKNRLSSLGKPKDELNSEQRYTDRQIFKRTRNSIIYQANDNKLSRKVALKKVLLDTFLSTEQRKQKLDKLLAEACIVSSLIHPNIVSVFDYFIEDGDGYIVMEWLEGKTLREMQNESGLIDFENVMDIGIQIAEALNYAHHHNIMHKDIKPENIMINRGKITILDFGLAIFLERDHEDSYRSYGTAMYMAPEQLNNDYVLDQRVDIFALGVLLYELLTIRYPYDPSVIMSKYAGENIISPLAPSEINFTCPNTLDLCLIKALKINPDERYQRINDFISDLKNIYSKTEREPDNKNIWKWIEAILKPGILILLFIIALLLYSTGKLLQKDKQELPDVKISVPAIPAENNEINSPISQKPLLAEKPDPTAEPTVLPTAEPDITAANGTWKPGFVTAKRVTVQADIKINEDANSTTVYVVINNHSDDELELLNRTDNPDLLNIKDDLGNDYTDKVDIRSVSSELIRIYPNSVAKGSLIMNTLISPQAKNLVVSLSEYEGKKRNFVITLDKE